jgi:hypothetical protein
MNRSENNNITTIILVICTFLLITILSIVLIGQITKVRRLLKNNETTETKVEETIEDTGSTDVDINKTILDTDVLYINILNAYDGEKNGVEGVYVVTNVVNRLDSRIKVQVSNAYSGTENISIDYTFTCEKSEELEKEMFIVGATTSDLAVSFSVNIIDALEEQLMYTSGEMIFQLKDKVPTVIKATALENNGTQESTPEASVEIEENYSDTPEVLIESSQESTEQLEEGFEQSEENSLESEEIESEEQSSQTESTSVVPHDGTTTVIGEYRYGFYTLPGTFTLQKEDGSYKEYLSADSVRFTIRYREGTTAIDFGNELETKYSDIRPTTKAEEIRDIEVDAKVDKNTGDVLIRKDADTELDISNAVDGYYSYKIYRYEFNAEDGRYVMFIIDAPTEGDCVTLDFLVPYELGKDYYADFVDEVMLSYEFIQ